MVSDEDGITIVQHCQFLGVPITLPELESTNLMLPPTNAESCCVFSLSISLQSLLGDETSRCLILCVLLLLLYYLLLLLTRSVADSYSYPTFL
jgi:hypothetical protein